MQALASLWLDRRDQLDFEIDGVVIKVDQTDVGRAGFVRCLPSGCVAEVVMEDKLIEQMSAGQGATFTISLPAAV